METQVGEVEHVQQPCPISKPSNTQLPNIKQEMSQMTSNRMKSQETTTSFVPAVVPDRPAPSSDDHYIYVKFGFSRSIVKPSKPNGTIRKRDEIREKITSWLKQMLETDL
jgi:hypothetical protein